MDAQSIRNFLDNSIATYSSNNADLASEFGIIKDLYESRLWHNLTEKVVQLIESNQLNGQELQQLYLQFIKQFETKINQFTLAQILVKISQTYTDPKEAIEFLRTLATKLQTDPTNQEPYLYLTSSIVLLSLSLGEDHLDESKKSLDLLEESIKNSSINLDSSIPANYYLALSQYFKIKNSPSEFYKTSMLYLSYANLEKIPIQKQREVSFDLGLAALVGEDTYSFGDLLSHPVLLSLRGTEFEWIEHLLNAFNSGNIEKYQELITTHHQEMANQPALVASADLLKQKISILSVMELVLDRSSSDRIFSFKEIAERSKLELPFVELLVMKALSLKLIKGHINQVNQTVVISWVQPRVLGVEQIRKMRDRLEDWRKTVHSTLIFVEQQTGSELGS